MWIWDLSSATLNLGLAALTLKGMTWMQFLVKSSGWERGKCCPFPSSPPYDLQDRAVAPSAPDMTLGMLFRGAEHIQPLAGFVQEQES